MRKRSKLFLFPLALSVILSGVAIGGGIQRGLVGNQTILKAEDSTNESTYTFTAQASNNTPIKVDENITWEITVTNKDDTKTPFYGYDTKKGAQFGSGNNPISNLSFTSNNKNKVSEIIIECSGASGTDATLNVTIEDQYTSNIQKLTSNSTSYNFKPKTPVTGTITLSFKCTKKAIYVKTITVKYEQQISTENKYVISFDNDGNITKTYVNDDGTAKLEKPADPTKDGYIFDGWYNGETEWNFDDPVTGDMTLTAKFKDLNLTDISLIKESDAGKFVRIEGKLIGYKNASVAYIQNGDATIQIYQSGGFTDSILKKSSQLKEPKNIQLTGQVGVNNDILQLTNLLSINEISKDVTINTIIDPTDVTKENKGKYVTLNNLKTSGSFNTGTCSIENKDFVLYYSNKDFVDGLDDFTQNSFVNVTGVIEVYNNTLEIVLFSISATESYTVSFDLNEGIGDFPSQTILAGNTVIEPATQPTKNNVGNKTYTFLGWYKDLEDTNPYDFSSVVTSNLTLHAKWKEETIPTKDSFAQESLQKNLRFGYTKKAVFSTYNLRPELEEIVFNNHIANLEDKVNITRKLDNEKQPTYPTLKSNELRLYKGTSLIFTPLNDVKINSIELTATNAKYLNSLSSKSASLTIKDKTITLNKVIDSVTLSNPFTGSDTIAFTSININYETATYSYSDFTDMQLQFKYGFDFTDATDVEETGIFVTDDNKFSFDSGEYDDNEYTFEEFITPGTNYHKFINKDKKASYIAGINLDPSQYNLDFYAAAYVKIDGKYYFSKNTQSSVQDLVLEYSYSTSLTEEQKAIIDALMSTIE